MAMKRGVWCAASLFCAVVLTAAPGPSGADDRDSYIVLKGGYYGPQEDIQGVDLKDGGYVELGLGHRLWLFGIELSGGYTETEAGDIETSTIPVLLTGKVGFPILMVYPYLEAGVGLYITDADNRLTGQSSDDTAFGYHGGLGVDVGLGPLLLGIEGRYIWVEPSFDGLDVKLNGVTVTGNVGYRF